MVVYMIDHARQAASLKRCRLFVLMLGCPSRMKDMTSIDEAQTKEDVNSDYRHEVSIAMYTFMFVCK